MFAGQSRTSVVAHGVRDGIPGLNENSGGGLGRDDQRVVEAES